MLGEVLYAKSKGITSVISRKGILRSQVHLLYDLPAVSDFLRRIVGLYQRNLSSITTL